jgi:hypothetical protein
MNNNNTAKISIMVRLPRTTVEYLDAESASIEAKHNIRGSRSAIIRGLLDGIAAAHFPASDAGPSSYHLRDAVSAALVSIRQEVRP